MCHRALTERVGRARSQYPFHSLLHNYVDALLMAVLESGTEPLLVHLVEHCKLLTALASAPQAILPRGGKHEVRLHSHPNKTTLAAAGSSVVVRSDERFLLTFSTSREQVRCGNLGHISRLGNKIAELAGSGEGALAEYCADHSGWQEWVESGLSERNAVENLTSWQCGRPRELDDSANDSDGDDDVLRGGFGMGGGFGSGGKLGWDNSAWRMETEESSDAYHRYSGDDKEEEEDDEDGEEEEEEEEEDGDIDSMKVLASFNFQGTHVSLQRQEDDGGSSSDESFEGASTAAGGGSTLPLGAVGAPADAEEDAVLIESDDDDEMVEASTVQQLSEKLTKATLDTAPEAPEEEEAPEFNQFNYWKTSFMMDIPDDI